MRLTLPDGYCIEVANTDHAAKTADIAAIADSYLVEEVDSEGYTSRILPAAKRVEFSNAFRVLFGQEPR